MFQIIKKNYFLLVSTFLILYFLFNLFGGERGFFSYLEKKHILTDLQEKEFKIINKISDLELKNSLLSTNLDLDYIETLIRTKFLYAKEKETIYVIDNEN